MNMFFNKELLQAVMVFMAIFCSTNLNLLHLNFLQVSAQGEKEENVGGRDEREELAHPRAGRPVFGGRWGGLGVLGRGRGVARATGTEVIFIAFIHCLP